MQIRGHIRKHLLPSLNVGGLRRWVVYQPLAVIMAILTLPSLSWMAADKQTARLFQAQAQTPVTCASPTNTIIQNYCTPAVGNRPSGNFNTDLVQLESDAVNAYLAAHNLPITDAHVIYDYGRADLRNAIRGHMISILLGVVATPASARTPHQQALYQWLQDLVWANEIGYVADSYNEFLKWQFDPCNYTLDAQVANQYGISYNGAAFCGVSESTVFNTEIPAPSYFKAVGLKRSYQNWASQIVCPVGANGAQDKSCNVAFQETTVNMAEVAGIAEAAGTIVVSAAAAPLIASFTLSASAYVTGLAGGFASAAEGTEFGGIAADSALYILSGSCLTGGGAVFALGSTIALMVMDIAVGVIAGVKAYDYQQSVNDLNDLKNQLTVVTNTPPDLGAADTTGLGLFKIENSVMGQTLKANADGTVVDLPSTAPLPAHQLGTDLEFENPINSTASSTFSFRGWNGQIWSAQTWGGWFVQTCANGTQIDSTADGTCIQADSISADLHYIDSRVQQTWSAQAPTVALPTAAFAYSGARFGNKFFATRAAGNVINQLASPGNTLNTCPVYPQNNVSIGEGYCWSYVDFVLPVVAADGSTELAELTNLLSPTFTTPTALAFGPGIPSTQTIKVTGDPTPIVCIVSSNLPGNFSISGSPSYAWMGTNNCSNLSGVGGFGTVNVQLAFDGLLNASIGTYSLTLQGVNNLGGANIHAVTQTFTINITPILSIISPNAMNVTSGVPANFTVVATGAPTPALSVDGVPLGGLAFTDNGNGTATISGIDSNTININSCLVSVSPAVPCALVATNSQGTYRQPFTIDLTPAPTAQLVCNPVCSTTFYAGAPNQLVLTSSGATTPVSWVFETDTTAPTTMPPYSWLSLQDNGDGTAILSGLPPYETTGASFNIGIHPSAQYSNTRLAQYTINVAGDPVFISPNSTSANAASSGTTASAAPLATHTLTAGSAATPNSFTISANTGTISLGSLLPTGLSFASSGNTATISGSPAAGTGGQYLLNLTDDGGPAGTASQQLILNVNEAPAITSASTAAMFVGTPGSLAVTTTGFPGISNHAILANPLPPTDPSLGNGMYFAIAGLPSDLSASNLDPTGFATGTLTIQGTPSAADVGTHQIQITAQNGVGSPAQQTLTLHVLNYSPTAPINLLSMWSLSRDTSNNVIATVVIANNGSQAAQNVSITSARIGSLAGVITPVAISTIAPESSATFSIQFPGASLGAPGSANVLTLSGAYTGGTFNNAGRIVLP